MQIRSGELLVGWQRCVHC